MYDLSRHPVTVEIDGNIYKGNYWIAGKIMTVSTSRGGRSRQVGATPPMVLAEQLLGDLVRLGKV